MKRLSWKRPGYDCMHAPCQHEKKGDHGISGGLYTWAVVTDEGDIGVDLCISAQEWPETIPVEKRVEMYLHERRRFREGRLTGSIGIHSTFATDRDGLRPEAKGRLDCKLVTPCCAVDSSYLAADGFAKVLQTGADGFPIFEQGEPFWQALEAWLAERVPGLRARRADLRWYVCPLCHGEGFCERKVTVPIGAPAPAGGSPEQGETPGSPPPGGPGEPY